MQAWIRDADNERIDDLIIGGMRLIQRCDQFRFSIDAVLLSHFVTVSPKRKVAELGTGTGVIPLLLAARGAASLYAFEVNPIMVDVAERNVMMNGKTETITVVAANYLSPAMKPWYGQFDDVVVNPPYRESGCGAVSQGQGRALALHESDTTLAAVVGSAKRLLRYGGRLWMIHLSERLTDILCTLRAENVEPKRIRVVYSRPGGRSKLVLIEAAVGGKPGCQMDPPLFIDGSDGQPSEEVQSWYE